jgi:hypothetical protein
MGVDHAAMGHAGSGRPHGGAEPSVDHSAMGHGVRSATPSAHPAAPSPADDKLLQLAAELVQDSAVRARIEADPELRSRWRDPVVRQAVTRAAP